MAKFIICHRMTLRPYPWRGRHFSSSVVFVNSLYCRMSFSLCSSARLSSKLCGCVDSLWGACPSVAVGTCKQLLSHTPQQSVHAAHWWACQSTDIHEDSTSPVYAQPRTVSSGRPRLLVHSVTRVETLRQKTPKNQCVLLAERTPKTYPNNTILVSCFIDNEMLYYNYVFKILNLWFC